MLFVVAASATEMPDVWSLTRPLPEGVQFFASVLTMPSEPVDSTLAFGAERQGLVLTPTEALFHVIDTPPSGGRKVAGTVIEWSVARQDVLRVEADDEACLTLVTATEEHRACLGAMRHHRADVLAAVTSWAPAPSAAAQAVVAAAVEASGLADPQALELRFTFRGTPYRRWLSGRRSVYTREVAVPGGGVRVDRLDGSTFTSTVTASPAASDALRRSLNSVAYFALLPRPLQDDAVIATLLGPSTLGGEVWDTVDVRFREDGGGDDHDDVFRYWFHPETHRLGYLAYTFATGDGGVRVRRAIRTHEVDGVVLVDWANHGRDGQGLTIDDAVRELEAGTLPQLSEIALEGVEVVRDAPEP